jgi:hypothetical protein
MKIIYRKKLGRATDLKLVKNNYILKTGDINFGNGDRLPDIKELHDLKYLKEIKKNKVNKNLRLKIYEKYTISDELKLIRIGITDKNNSEFVEYDNYCNEKREISKNIKKRIMSVINKKDLDSLVLEIE